MSLCNCSIFFSFSRMKLTIRILLHKNFWHTNKIIGNWPVAYLGLQLSILYMSDQELESNLGYVLLCFFFVIFQSQSFLYSFNILLHLVPSFKHSRSLFIPYAYVSVESTDCILLSLLALNSVLLTSSVNNFVPRFKIIAVILI